LVLSNTFPAHRPKQNSARGANIQHAADGHDKGSGANFCDASFCQAPPTTTKQRRNLGELHLMYKLGVRFMGPGDAASDGRANLIWAPPIDCARDEMDGKWVGWNAISSRERKLLMPDAHQSSSPPRIDSPEP